MRAASDTGCVPPIYVHTSSRDDAEQLAWSLLGEDVRLAFAGERWAVRVVAGDGDELIETVERCIRRLRLGPVAYRA